MSYGDIPAVFLYVRLFRHYRRIQPVDDVALLHFAHEEENVLPHLDMLPEGQIRHEQTAAGAAMPLDGEALRCGMLPQLVGGLLQPRFLGLGIQPPSPEWGNMLSDARSYISYATHTLLFPGLAVMTVILAYNLIGDGLRDAMDPRIRGR